MIDLNAIGIWIALAGFVCLIGYMWGRANGKRLTIQRARGPIFEMVRECLERYADWGLAPILCKTCRQKFLADLKYVYSGSVEAYHKYAHRLASDSNLHKEDA